MPVVSDGCGLRATLADWRRAGARVAFVPTMGNLHQGHLDLVHAAAAAADRVVVSIFVNPLQFGPGEDFAAYPRTLEDDLARLEGSACSLVFAPPEAVMYPSGRTGTTRVEVPGLADLLCGASRPGHFAGVTTVVAKLFNLVQPDLAAFGQKDYQQLTIVRRMVADLDFPVEILGVPTRREADGLAMSSRNRYLGAAERRVAPALHGALQAAADALRRGERDFVALQQAGMDNIRSAGMSPEYFEVRRQDDLGTPNGNDRNLVVLAASKLGRARLIDNLLVDLD
ncbi:pantoate--beta-alanine ligase [Thioalkalivibrio sp. XN279]|uniref:pantoate--beta-alanine ligase n=1 Tax=Thioalkalivibrio sp. XN279 TaxID=2714953 RepID=UPI0014089EE3|nr:pantoate--beta-alanine ligase [Thioalkalivibrio sp. XN279]NHA14785.1 pantoate--beta-alanine ligase [Thioalkalivibrio sp. XN279]